MIKLSKFDRIPRRRTGWARLCCGVLFAAIAVLSFALRKRRLQKKTRWPYYPPRSS